MSHIITPAVMFGDKCLNIRVSTNDNRIVMNNESNKFIVCGKDGSVPDIELDADVIDELIEARRLQLCFTEMSQFMKQENRENELNDRRFMLSVLTAYADKMANVRYDELKKAFLFDIIARKLADSSKQERKDETA